MNMGWNCFFSLLIALMVGALSDKLIGLEGLTPWIVGLVAFVIVLAIFTINRYVLTRRKNKIEKLEEKLD